MSKHSRNSNSQSIFTYGERQKLKGVYGSKQERISQDSIKTFDMCTICNNRIIQPVCCDKGHIFCRTCAIEYLVRQKKKIAQNNEKVELEKKKDQERQTLKKMEQEAMKVMKFEKYDNFEQLGSRKKFVEEDVQGKDKKNQVIVASEAKPIGMYEITGEKDKYIKSSFWAIENTPALDKKNEKMENIVKCPGSDHKLTLKKLRTVIVKDIQSHFICGICSKEIGRQKIGSYKCGHLICHSCKSDKCEICSKDGGWIDIESSASSFSSHSKANIKTYTHAFYM